MGKTPETPAQGKQNKRSNSGRKAKNTNGFIFSSFYPTKEEKAEIKAMMGLSAEFMTYLTRVTDLNLVVTIKPDIDKDCLMLMLRENVPFGEPCKAISLWHTDLERLVAQFCYWMQVYSRSWLEDDRALAEQMEMDW